MKKIINHIGLIVFLVLLFNQKLFATAQIPDLLIHNGDTINIFSNPLESFFSESNPRPKSIINGGCWNTACWHGYQAIWEISDGRLYLNEILDCCFWEKYVLTEKTITKLKIILPDNIIERFESLDYKVYKSSDFKENINKTIGKEAYLQYKGIILETCLLPRRSADLNRLFQNKVEGGRVCAYWFNGKIIAPQGNLLHYEHMGYCSIYARDQVFTVQSGKIVSDETFSNQEFYEAYYKKIPDSIETYVYEKLDWTKIPKRKRNYISASLYVNSNGELDSLSVFGNDIIKAKVEEVLNEVEKYEPVYRHAKIYKLPIIVNFIFDRRTYKKYGP